MKIIFFGTPEFGAIVLKGLAESEFKPALVVTAPDKPAGRKQLLTPPPVKETAERYGIPVLQSADLKNLKVEIEHSIPDLCIVASFGQILPKEILALPKFGTLNVHPSLLPMYRGASPIQAAILRGDEQTGVTIMLMDENIDHGPIVAQERLGAPIGQMTFLQLHDALALLGTDLLKRTIPPWIGGTITPLPQDHSKATFTKQLKKTDGIIDWRKPADFIEKQIRAFTPWPGAVTSFTAKNGETKMVKILKAKALEENRGEPPNHEGMIARLPNGMIAARTGKDNLAVEELQLEGGRPMKIKEFIQGHPDLIGSTLGQKNGEKI